MGTFSKRQIGFATFMAALLVAVLAVSGLALSMAEAAAEKTETGKPAPAETDFSRLEGKWVRPDGGYVLELKNIRKDGSLTAAYFNPRPIKVFRAELSRKEGKMTLFVELRDINYPGSTYTLQYDPVTDQLKGKYFQAVERQTFDILFIRAR
jgi:hypothetical protein